MLSHRHFTVGLLLICLLATAGCEFFMDADARVQRASGHIAKRDYQTALIDLRSAVQSEPDHAEARRLLAEVLLQLGDAAGAEQELRRAIEKGVPPASAADLAARVDLRLGRYASLLARIDAGELPIEEPQRSIYRGRALLGIEKGEEALAAFDAALAVAPQSTPARVGRAQALFAQGKADAALAELDAAITADPSAATAQLARGTILTTHGHYAEAQKALLGAHANAAATLTIDERAVLLLALAETQLAQGDPKTASATHKELAALVGGDSPLVQMLAARIAIASQDYTKAISDLQRIVTRMPDIVPARFLLGAALLAQGNLNQAEMQLSQVLQRAPENLEARKLLAQVRLRLERPEAAMQVLLAAQQPDLEDSQLDLLTGMAHLQLGDSTRGIEHLERALASDPNNRTLQLDLAGARARAGDYEKAVSMLRSMPRVAGDLRREQLLVAVQVAAKGPSAGRAEVDRLVADQPRDIEVLNFAGLFLAQEREFGSARALLTRADQAQPKNTTTLMNRARVEIAAGNSSAAGEWLQRIVAVEPSNMAARLALAELAIRRGDAPAATRSLEELRAQDQQALEPRLRLARIYLQQKESTQAEAVLKEARALVAGKPEALNSLGLLFLETGRYEEALSQFHTATGLAEGNPAYWLNVARAQLALDHAPAARDALEKALALRTRWLPAVEALALLDLRENKRDAAFARVADLKTAMPHQPAVQVLEGDLMMIVKDYPRAAGAYSQALALRPDTTTVLKTFRARQLGKLDDPSAPLQAWLRQRPEDFVVRTVLADEYLTGGQHRQAAEQYERITKDDPGKVGALNNLAWLYQSLGDERAEATAARAYKVAPGSPAVADTYGWILVQRGKVEQGLELLKRAAAGAEGDPGIEYHYAVALARSGARTEARDRLARLVERSDGFADKTEAARLLRELSAP
jgi:putative PEP-CTERM system TPR-repeat lipoprotein